MSTKKTATVTEEPYKDDLKFLNKLNSNKIANLSNTFKNPGRAPIKEEKEQLSKGMWEPVVGQYHPNYKFVHGQAVAETHGKFSDEVDTAAIDGKKENHEMRKTKLC